MKDEIIYTCNNPLQECHYQKADKHVRFKYFCKAEFNCPHKCPPMPYQFTQNLKEVQNEN